MSSHNNNSYHFNIIDLDNKKDIPNGGFPPIYKKNKNFEKRKFLLELPPKDLNILNIKTILQSKYK